MQNLAFIDFDFFVSCCHSDIDFTKNCMLTNFNLFIVSHW